MKKQIITSIVIIAISSLVVAQNSRMGSASSTQLLAVPSAKHLSGGGAAATAIGMDATFWNPAGLAMSENSIDAIFSNRQYFADIDNSFFGIATDIGEYKITVKKLDSILDKVITKTETLDRAIKQISNANDEIKDEVTKGKRL